MRRWISLFAFAVGTMASRGSGNPGIHLDPLPDIPAINLTFPSSRLALSALAYTKEHTSSNTVNHCLRSAYFAVILSKKHPSFAGKRLNLDLVVFSVIMHDLGWATTKSLLSQDRRFEVDGADLARAFLEKHAPWDEHQRQLAWDAIALHTTPSIAQFKQPEVGLAQLGILHDFLGPNGPGGLLTAEEYRAVASLFPRVGWTDEFVQIMCGLCRDKPAATYQTFADYFGVTYGLDGKGGGKEQYKQALEGSQIQPRFLASMKELEESNVKGGGNQ